MKLTGAIILPLALLAACPEPPQTPPPTRSSVATNPVEEVDACTRLAPLFLLSEEELLQRVSAQRIFNFTLPGYAGYAPASDIFLQNYQRLKDGEEPRQDYADDTVGVIVFNRYLVAQRLTPAEALLAIFTGGVLPRDCVTAPVSVGDDGEVVRFVQESVRSATEELNVVDEIIEDIEEDFGDGDFPQ